jgi:hypothetical protein
MISRTIALICVGMMALTLAGCVGESTCAGDFVSGNQACAAGCAGIEVARTARCVWHGETLTWCVDRSGDWRPDDVPCIVDTSTGEMYRSSGYPDSLPAHVRYCSEEEEALLGDFTGCE